MNVEAEGVELDLEVGLFLKIIFQGRGLRLIEQLLLVNTVTHRIPVGKAAERDIYQSRQVSSCL